MLPTFYEPSKNDFNCITYRLFTNHDLNRKLNFYLFIYSQGTDFDPTSTTRWSLWPSFVNIICPVVLQVKSLRFSTFFYPISPMPNFPGELGQNSIPILRVIIMLPCFIKIWPVFSEEKSLEDLALFGLTSQALLKYRFWSQPLGDHCD